MSTSGSGAETGLSDPLTADACSRRLVILVNDLPAAGKTTLARALSRRLSLPLFSKDVIKEAHADIFGAQPPDGRPQRAWNSHFGAAANATIWALLADSPGGAVLERQLARHPIHGEPPDEEESVRPMPHRPGWARPPGRRPRSRAVRR